MTRTRQRAQLDRGELVEHALALADVEGIGAITLRRLAQDFGVTPMALYWHFANKDALLDAMGDHFYDELVIPDDGDWAQWLGDVTRAIVGALRRHPGSAHLAAPRVLQCERGRDLTEQALTLLRAQGFSPERAVDIARTALQTAVMLVCEQAGAEVDVGAAHRAEVVAAKRAAIAALPPERYPNVVQCAAALTTTSDEDAYYRFGVDLFVAGVRTLHRDLAAQSRP